MAQKKSNPKVESKVPEAQTQHPGIEPQISEVQPQSTEEESRIPEVQPRHPKVKTKLYRALTGFNFNHRIVVACSKQPFADAEAEFLLERGLIEEAK